MTRPRPIPYPSDTRAKGWRFELDYERIEQSDTWAIAEEFPMAQHALVFMWLAAWKQEPCGSFPNDESVIRSKCRVPVKLWTPMRDVLMRGWWLAEDDRLYHDTMTKRVLEMLEYRAGNAKRVAKHKEAMRLKRSGNALPTQQQPVKNDTGTGTGSKQGSEGGEDRDPPENPDLQGHTPTPAGAACQAMRLAGIVDTIPSSPDLLRLLDAGVTAQELAGIAAVAVGKGKPSMAYVLATVEGKRADAAAKAAVPAAVVLPPPVATVASDAAERTADLLRQQDERAATATKPPAALVALLRRNQGATA